MKDRALWTFVALAALVLAGLYWLKNKTPPAASPAAPAITATPAPSAPTASKASAPVAAAPASTATAPAMIATATPAGKKPKPEVDIQEGKTIDFSSGVAVVKDDAAQKAIIDKSVKEMDSALQGVTFAPAAKAPEATPAPAKP